MSALRNKNRPRGLGLLASMAALMGMSGRAGEPVGTTGRGIAEPVKATVVSSQKKAPVYVQRWLEDRAMHKRIRRAENPRCSNYARANVR